MPATTDELDQWNAPAYAAAARTFAQAEKDRERDQAAHAAILNERAAHLLTGGNNHEEAARSMPGKTALERACMAIHAGTVTTGATLPARKPTVERASAAPARTGGAITALLGSGPDLLTRAASRGIALQRVASFSGHKCSTPACTYNAAWQASGRYLCNQHIEKAVGR